MARLVTSGFESKDLGGSLFGSVECPAPFAATTGYVAALVSGTIDGTIFRSGAFSAKLNSGAGNTSSYAVWRLPQQASDTIFIRAYMLFTNLPGSSANVLRLFYSANDAVGVSLSSGGAFTLWHGTAASTIGSASVEVVTAGNGKWYRVELSITFNATPQVTGCELRVNGVSVAIGSGLTDAASGTVDIMAGWPGQRVAGQLPGANSVCYVDDVGINDSTGANQNSWPGDGKVVLSLPVSDAAVGSWKAGSAASAASNGALFDAVNNTPPVGVVSPDGVTACISNTVSAVTGPDYIANLMTYGSLGIMPKDFINCATNIIAHGEDVSTGSKTGAFANADTIGAGNSSQFGPSGGGAVGTYPTNWVAQMGVVSYAYFAGDVTSVPQFKVSKTDTGTRAADVCFIGQYIDYTPGPVEQVASAIRGSRALWPDQTRRF